jgi:hypothetical protein
MRIETNRKLKLCRKINYAEKPEKNKTAKMEK